jgi:hypothetical protein
MVHCMARGMVLDKGTAAAAAGKGTAAPADKGMAAPADKGTAAAAAADKGKAAAADKGRDLGRARDMAALEGIHKES